MICVCVGKEQNTPPILFSPPIPQGKRTHAGIQPITTTVLTRGISVILEAFPVIIFLRIKKVELFILETKLKFNFNMPNVCLSKVSFKIFLFKGKKKASEPGCPKQSQPDYLKVQYGMEGKGKRNGERKRKEGIGVKTHSYQD